MAKVILNPIGGLVEHDAQFQAQTTQNQALAHNLGQRREQVRLGWGESYQERVRKKGKLTVWERVSQLADNPVDILPIHTFVNDGLQFGDEQDKRTSPAAGVITAFVKIHQRWCMVIANDNTVASGSWWPKTPEKIIRAQEIALKLKIPVVYLVDCSGLFLPEQSKSFPGQRGAGHIFKKNAELSAQGIPQIAGVMGDCIAGGGYMPIISDKVYMTEQAYMVIAGAALIQGAKSQNLSSLDIGGAHIHVHISNCADFRVPDDATCIVRLREEVAQMSSSAIDYYRNGAFAGEPQLEAAELLGIVPKDNRSIYDVRQVIARLVDNSLFWEVLPHVGQEVIVGVAKISGLYVGIAANVQALTPHPHQSGVSRPGGILYREGVAKLSTFSRLCNDDGIPLIWLQDVSGFDVGLEAEKQGLLGYGSNLIYSNSTNQTPMMTVLLRKASGAGYYAMAGLPYDPVLQLATPLTRLAVMEGRTLAIGAYNSKLDANFAITSQDPKERASIEAGMKAVSERIEQDMDPYRAASQMDVDELIQLDEIRAYARCMLEAAYQSQGVRRIKNPRIWSLHDLEIITHDTSQPQANAKKVSAKTSPSLKHTLKAGEQGIVAPMEGMFYRRPSGQDPAFVQEGDEIEPGTVVGLIEVMKCFYPIKYEGKKRVKVKSLMMQESGAVNPGDLLLIVE